MLSNDEEYINEVMSNVVNVRTQDLLPKAHQMFLDKMRCQFEFCPNVVYDIGAAVLHWTRHCERVWGESKIYLFDAFAPAEKCYYGYDYNMGVLADEDDTEIKFYQNDMLFGGNSIYREVGEVFPEDKYIIKKTKKLDTVVKGKGYRLPDLIKIDVQGAELLVLKGAVETLKHCKYLIVELQDVHYNEGAPLADETIQWLKEHDFECVARKFSDNGPDADYCFVNTKI